MAYELHVLVIWVCVAIGALVIAVMLYSIYAHRRSQGASRPQFHNSVWVEVMWTMVPVAIVIATAAPAIRSMIEINSGDNTGLMVKITGHQWGWRYQYPDLGLDFFSHSKLPGQGTSSADDQGGLQADGPLVLPIGTRVSFQLASMEVPSVWWIPELGWKQEIFAGQGQEYSLLIERPGTYPGRCAAPCDSRRADFTPVVVVMERSDYRLWLQEKPNTGAPRAHRKDTE